MSVVSRIPDLESFFAYSIALEEEAAERQEQLLQKHVGPTVRTMDEFLSDQIGYEERKVQKLQELAH